MLKLKSGVDIKELEKHGFKSLRFQGCRQIIILPAATMTLLS